ncbi:MAG: hypothetical protein J6L93_04360 [Butyrivibrio sp.]|nr:hypothetical protein [Butyrivibrio sp.]
MATERIGKLQKALFYLALTIELVLMIVEKSEISFGYESYVFRATFILTLISMVLLKRDKKEWVVLAALVAFTFLCYEISGKNDLLRVVVFMAAARDIDLKKAIKYSFRVSFVGFTVVSLLALAGVLGDIYLVTDYGRGIANESRMVLGFGHPNTLFGCVYVLVLMWLWLYGEGASILAHIVVIMISFTFAALTRSRTGIAVLAMTLVLAVILRLVPKLKEVKLLYFLEALVTPIMCIVFAVIAAGFAEYAYTGHGIQTPSNFWQFDEKMNGRISNLYYGVPNHGGILCNIRLIAGRGTDGFFDLGWNRLLYWYGYLPTLLIAVAILCLIYLCYKKRDMWTLLIILSVSVYTIIEATFVTRYIGRCFYFLIAGVYFGYLFKRKTDD